MKIVKPSFEFQPLPSGDVILQIIEAAGRTCYKSEDKITPDSARTFVANILKSGHESVIEHVSASVRLTTDRGVTHEVVRHRIAAYSQESTRYCNYGSGKFGREITVIDPIFFAPDSVSNSRKRAIWMQAMLAAEGYYLQLLDEGATPQEARTVLPNSLKTEIYMTYNLREWRHFFKLRAVNPKAHPQMREVAIPMLEKAKELIPVIFDDLVVAK